MNTFDMEFDKNDDENFFENLMPRTNLEQLFGIEDITKHENTTLRYQPVKQINNIEDFEESMQSVSTNANAIKMSTTTNQVMWNTQIAKVAHAYRSHDPIGRVGVAILKNAEGACKIILYKTKTNILCAMSRPAAGGRSARVHMQKSEIQFFDDHRRLWSLRFEKLRDEREFIAKLKEYNFEVLHDMNLIEGVNEQKNNQDSHNSKSVHAMRLDTKIDPDNSAGVDVGIAAAMATDASGAAVANLSDNVQPVAGIMKTQKNDLLTRMARMGKPVPFSAQQQQDQIITKAAQPSETPSMPIELSDSSDRENVDMHLAVPMKNALLPRTTKNKVQTSIVTATTNMGMYSSLSSSTHMETQMIQMMLSENRSQNMEMRMNMNKIESRIDRVLDKIDNLNSNSNHSKITNRDDEVLQLEEKLLELKKENRRLKHALEHNEFERHPIPDAHAEKMQKIMRLFGEDFIAFGISINDDMEGIVSKLIDKINEMNRSNKRTEFELSEQMKKNDEFIENNNSETQQLINESLVLREQIEATQNTMQLKDNTIKDNEAKLKLQMRINDDMQDQLNKQIRLGQDLRDDLAKVKEQSVSIAEKQKMQTADIVKVIMNGLYGLLSSQIERYEFHERDDVIAIIGKTIREETLKAILQLK